MSDQPTCSTCGLWHRQGATIAKAARDPSCADDVGTCHYGPPIIAPTVLGPESFFPVTHASRFCGAWTPARGEEPDGDGPDDGETVLGAERTDNVVHLEKAA